MASKVVTLSDVKDQAGELLSEFEQKIIDIKADLESALKDADGTFPSDRVEDYPDDAKNGFSNLHGEVEDAIIALERLCDL